MRTAFIETLLELARDDERVWLLCGDLGFSVLEPFIDRFPDRFVNSGVAEQNLMGMAAGIALAGGIPFTYSIANFPVMRCLEQIRNDVCYHGLPVRIVAVGGGVSYGAQGYTHHGLEDIAVLRALPNMTVICPGDPVETRAAVRSMMDLPGPCYLRLGRAGEPVVHESLAHFAIGRAIWLRRGEDVTLISTGAMLWECTRAAIELEKQQISAGVLSMHTVKPLDDAAIREAVGSSRMLVTVEEHSRTGGLGAAALESLADLGIAAPVLRLGLDGTIDNPGGSQNYLRRLARLDAAGIAEQVASALIAR